MTVALPDIKEIVKMIGVPFKDWSHQCHSISLLFVQSDLFPQSRVARGSCKGIWSQHSWVVIGDDCYDPKCDIVDPTLWSYDPTVEGIWVGNAKDKRHTPHGAGIIWQAGRPPEPTDEPIELAVPVSDEARSFLRVCGPLDLKGWMTLAELPVGGWPAAEIITAMGNTPKLAAVTPIDRVGMLTDINPQGLYLKGPADAQST